MLRNPDEQTPDIRKLQSQVAHALNLIQGPGGINDTVANQGQSINSLLTSRAVTPAAPVGNLLWNGEEGHSVNTWHDTVRDTAPIDKAKEAAWWFSHNAPATAKTFTSVDVSTGADTVSITNHGFTNGCAVDLLEGSVGTLPAPLAVVTTYFLIVVDLNTLKFATTVGFAEAGTAIDLTTTGTAAVTFTIQQILVGADARTTTVSNTLKTTAHASYNARYSRWNSTNGWGELTGTTTIDELMPSNIVDATTPLARISLIAAKKNSFIEIPNNCLMFAGIWDNTSGQRKFLTGNLGFVATVTGTPGTTKRNFRILITSDRGYSILSDEVVITTAAADNELSSTRNISMSWLRQAGQLQVDIYEHFDPGGAGDQFRLLAQVSSASSFIYEGGSLQTVAGYPTPTTTVRTATFFTNTGDMAALATDGVSGAWDTVNFPILVPDNYNKGNTTDRQWLRLGLTAAPNLYIAECVSNGATPSIITVPTGAIDSSAVASGGYGTGSGSLYAGHAVQYFDANGTLVFSDTLASVTSDTVFVATGTITAGTYTIRIVGAGFHGVYIDKIHMGYQQNTSYVPNAFDFRILQPLAAPASSSQGTVGGGGSGGGIDTCVVGLTPIKMHGGDWRAIETTREGQQWSAGQLAPNILVKLKRSPEKVSVRRVRSANGCVLVCTDSEAFMIQPTDASGTPLYRLRVGDPVMTEIDGRIEQSTFAEISSYISKEIVYTPALSHNNLFIAGELKVSLWRRGWSRVTSGRTICGGFILHNEKPFGGGDPPIL